MNKKTVKDIDVKGKKVLVVFVYFVEFLWGTCISINAYL